MRAMESASTAARKSTAGQPTASLRSARIWLGLVGMAAALVAVYQIHKWWGSPEHRMRQFVGAARRQHVEGMLSLADPEEIRRLGLTAHKLQAMLVAAAGAPGGVMPGNVVPLLLNEDQSRYNRHIQVSLYDRNGRPLSGPMSTPAKATVIAYRTDHGWKIAVSEFIYGVMIAHHGREFRKERFARMCLRHGIEPALYWATNDEWEQLSPTR